MLAGSLKGIRVLDLTRLFPGPLCTLMLADLGAEVIKIEPPEGEFARHLPPHQFDVGSTFLQLNRGKKSLTLNLKSDQGRAIFDRLLDGADVLVESFRPGTMARLGLDFERVSKRRPEIVYCSISAFGQAGPAANHPAHDLNLIAIAGILSLSGSPGKALVVPPVQIADVLAGFQAAIAICAALLRRFREGKGQYLDISMLDGAFFTMISLVSMHYAGFFQNDRSLFLSGRLACYNVYRTRDDRYLALALLEPKFWANFCSMTGLDSLQNAQMQPDQAEVKRAISNRIAEKSLQEWVDFFNGADVCVSPVKDLEEALADPQIAFRKLLVDVPYSAGVVKHLRTPFVEEPQTAPCPELGSDNEEILLSVRYSKEEIEGFRNRGVI